MDQSNLAIHGLLKAGIDKNQQPIYILIGNLIDDKNVSDLALQLNKYLSTFRPFKQFVIVYCNQEDREIKVENLKTLLKGIAKNVEDKQLERLNRLLIVSSSYRQDQIAKVVPAKQAALYKNKIVILPNLNNLDDYDIALHQSVFKFLFSGGVFQQETPFYGRTIQEYPIAKSGIPVFLEEILNFFSANDEYLKSQGVFRIPGSTEKEETLLERLKHQDYSALNEFPPEVVATVLKNTLVNLKEPIFPFEMYETLKDQKNDSLPQEKLIEMFQVFFAYLDRVNRNTIKRLAGFLHHVAEYEEHNSMGLHNLSIVFTPCFFRPEKGGISDLAGAGKVVKYFLWLIQNVDVFIQEEQPLRQSMNISV